MLPSGVVRVPHDSRASTAAKNQQTSDAAPRSSLYGGYPIVAPDDGSSIFECKGVNAGWSEVCSAMERALAPIMPAWRSFMGKGVANESRVVLLIDEALAPLPLEVGFLWCNSSYFRFSE